MACPIPGDPGGARRVEAFVAACYAGVGFVVVGILAANGDPAPPLVSAESVAANGLLALAGLALSALTFAYALRSGRRSRRLLAALAGVCLSSLVATTVLSCTVAGRVTAGNPKNVILIGIDTLRLDHISLSGLNRNGRDTTPNLRKLAEKGIAFRGAVSQAPWTMPAFASILTGRYPHEHGAYSLSGYLPSRNVTLAEVLREAGFATGGVVSHFFVDSQHGFSQGMDRFDQSNSLGHEAITSERVTDLAMRYVEDHRDKPFFLFVHYFDPHYEWRDHADWDFSDDYTGWLRNSPLNITSLRHQRHLLQEADIAYLQDLYDEEIAYTDRHIGRLLDFLAQQGLDADTAVVVVADHGEEFLEHGWLGHTTTLYDEVIHVPLLCVLPGAMDEPGAVDAVVETRAVFQLVLDYLGVEWGSEAGPSLLAGLRQPGTLTFPDEAYSSVWLPDAPLASGKRIRLSGIRTPHWKLIEDHIRNRAMLFDLQSDPGERINRFGTGIEQEALLGDNLNAWLEAVDAETAQAARRSLAPQERDQLEALGYF